MEERRASKACGCGFDSHDSYYNMWYDVSYHQPKRDMKETDHGTEGAG